MSPDQAELFPGITKRPSPNFVKSPLPVIGASQTNEKPFPTLIPPPPSPSSKLVSSTVSELSRRKIEPLLKNIDEPDDRTADSEG